MKGTAEALNCTDNTRQNNDIKYTGRVQLTSLCISKSVSK